MSRFAPVHLPPERALNRKASATFLKSYDACPRSGYMYSKFKGAMQTMEMVRGTAEHTMLQRAVEAMIAQGEPMIPPDVMKAIVNEVLAEEPVPFMEHDYLRESAYRWAEEWAVDPEAVIACETLLVLDLDGWQVRCKVDFAEARAGGMVVYVADYKSSRAAPGFDEIARRRKADGTMTKFEQFAAKNFQLILYALALAFGHPVRVEPCAQCAPGTSQAQQRDEGDSGCDACRDRRYVEIIEPFPLANQAERFDLEFVYPGIEDREGKMVRRPVSLTRLELGEYRESLIGLLRRVAASEESGDWPAVISDQACTECPCKPECPIPRELRDYAGEINTVEQAREAAEVLDRRASEQAALRKEIKAFAKGHDVEIRYGKDKAFRFVYGEADRIADKDALFDAVERARLYGEPFDRALFVKTVGSTEFKAVKLSDDELAVEAGEQE